MVGVIEGDVDVGVFVVGLVAILDIVVGTAPLLVGFVNTRPICPS